MKSLLATVSGRKDCSSSAGANSSLDASLSPRSNRKKILFVTNTFEFGGAEKHLLELVRRLIAPELELIILCLKTDFYSEHLDRDHCSQVLVVRWDKQLNSFWDWHAAFRELRPDVVFFVWAYLWCFEWYVPVAAWLAGIPKRISIAQLTPPPPDACPDNKRAAKLFDKGRHAYRLLKRQVSGHFNSTIISVSNGVRDALIRNYHFPASKTITVHNGVGSPDLQKCQNDGTAVRDKLGIGRDEFLLVCVARLSEQKRIDILLRALAKQMRDGVPCKCVIVGDGPLRDGLSQQALELGLTGRVFFEGFQQETQSYLQASNAFILSSDREGLPIAMLEAMSFGLPCIVTNVGGNAEAITDRVHGMVVPAGSPDDLATAISYLIAHPRELAEMSKAARARAQQKFNIEDRMAEIKNIILSEV
jgi:glycosyltransferase involved in cell wall biosynthesis